MRALSEADFLGLWEQGRALNPIDAGLLAIRYASLHGRRECLADWPIGRRNRALLELRAACFGPALCGWVACRRCPERLEFALDAPSLVAGLSPRRESVVVGGRTLRLPTSRDLACVAGEEDLEQAALTLATRCLVDGAEPRDEDIDVIGKAMALADPLADVALHFDCLACGESFDESLDLPAFVFTEVEARAKRLLRDVHTLAVAYGWPESEVLSLSAARRETYVAMVCA